MIKDIRCAGNWTRHELNCIPENIRSVLMEAYQCCTFGGCDYRWPGSAHSLPHRCPNRGCGGGVREAL